MGIRGKLKEKAVRKASEKLGASIPALQSFAVNNDRGYDALAKALTEINKKRKRARKYIYPIRMSRA